MLRALAFAFILAQFPPPAVDTPKHAAPAWLDPGCDAASRLTGEALVVGLCVEAPGAARRYAYGNRLSWIMPNLDAAITWAVEEMKKDGLDNVHTEPVKVPHWVRGHESLEIAGAIPQPLVILGLGNSVGTPAGGVDAELLVVHSFEELDAAGGRVKGKIVLFNVPFTNYGETVRFRATVLPVARGALGAAAALVRPPKPAVGSAHTVHRRAHLQDGTAADPAAALRPPRRHRGAACSSYADRSARRCG